MTVRAVICASVTSSHGHRCNRLCLCHLMGASDRVTFSVTQERQTVPPVWLLVGALLLVRDFRTGAVRELKGGSSILLSCKIRQIIHPLSVDKKVPCDLTVMKNAHPDLHVNEYPWWSYSFEWQFQ